jgi:HAD superfamily hydrolase (TIGR01509 family)
VLVLELVIFDCDGVLVDSERISSTVLAQSLSEHGLATTPAEARRDYEGLLLRDIDARASAKLGRALPEDWLERFQHDRADVFRRELQPITGAGEAVEAISAAGIRVCVASQGKLEKTRLSLELTGLDRLFSEEVLFSAWSVKRGKPFPDVFLHAAEAMGVDADRCAVIEDSVLGVTAAVAAGMRVLGYGGSSTAEELRRAGAEVVDSLGEVPLRLGLQAA